MSEQIVTDIYGDQITVRSIGESVELEFEGDLTFMDLDQDAARELADALMRASASLNWKGGTE